MIYLRVDVGNQEDVRQDVHPNVPKDNARKTFINPEGIESAVGILCNGLSFDEVVALPKDLLYYKNSTVLAVIVVEGSKMNDMMLDQLRYWARDWTTEEGKRRWISLGST